MKFWRWWSRVVSAWLGSGLLAVVLALDGQPPVLFAPERDYGPFVFQSEDGVVRGLSIDVLDLVRRHTGLTWRTLPPRPLAEILTLAQAGQVDLISSLRPTPERSAYLAFTRPYVTVPTVLVTRAGDSGIELDNGRPYRIAVGAGYAVEQHVRQRFGHILWQALPDDAAGLRALMAGQVDGVVADAASVSFLRRQLGLSNLTLRGGIAFEYSLSLAYRRNLPWLGDVLERGLAAISHEERQVLLRRWIDAEALEVAQDERSRWTLRIGLALLALGLLLALVAGLTRSGRRRNT